MINSRVNFEISEYLIFSPSPHTGTVPSSVLLWNSSASNQHELRVPEQETLETVTGIERCEKNRGLENTT